MGSGKKEWNKEIQMEKWEKLSHEEKIEAIEKVLEEEVRPFVARDGGGVRLVELRDQDQVVIAYEGACRGCFAATTSTLAVIQEVLRERLSSKIVVITEV
jgi:NifU-like protein